MLYDPTLVEWGRKDFHPKPEIEESIKGVKVEFFFTGKRLGSGNQIELHVTSIVRDWEENLFVRKAWYRGNKQTWRKCIEQHVRNHLEDLATGHMLIMSLMREFEIHEEHFKAWEKYKPVYYR